MEWMSILITNIFVLEIFDLKIINIFQSILSAFTSIVIRLHKVYYINLLRVPGLVAK